MKRTGKKGYRLLALLLISACIFGHSLTAAASGASGGTEPSAATEVSTPEETETVIPDETETLPPEETETLSTEETETLPEESSPETLPPSEEGEQESSAEIEDSLKTTIPSSEESLETVEGEETISLYGANGVPDVRYWTHIQTYGWTQGWKKNGEEAGTHGQAKRLEAIYIEVQNQGSMTGGIRYRTHVQSYGWQGWKENGQLSGTQGQFKRLEGIQIELTGELAQHYDVYYCVHAQTFGWLDWAKNGAMAGTSGMGKRLEGIRIQLVPKGGAKPAPIEKPGRSFIPLPKVAYRVHAQSYGTMNWVSDGATSGVVGRNKRLESLAVKLTDSNMYGNIEYRTHVQSKGWLGWSNGGVLNGTTGLSKRVEALQVRLTGEASGVCDIYYRVYVEGYGWLGWAKNGEMAGTSGFGLRAEAIEIRIASKSVGSPVVLGEAPYREYTGPGLYQMGNQLRFYFSAGSSANGNGWTEYNGQRYYFRNGVPLVGWNYVDGLKYYFNSDGTLCQNIDSIIGPQSSYLIKVNKLANCITIYAYDPAGGYIIPVKAMLCSTGDDTPLGTFYTPEKYRWRAMFNGTYAQYATRLTKGEGFLFHSVTYERPNNRTMIAYGYNGLGTVRSSGCIRLVCGEAYWIYTRCRLGTTVVVYNDPNPGPFGRPVVAPIPENQTWDPTDPEL